jgi:ABC-type nitrate/sulfonate/bicarbonate transport system permease component
MIIVIGAMGIALDMGFEAVRAKLTSWADRQTDNTVSSL